MSAHVTTTFYLLSHTVLQRVSALHTQLSVNTCLACFSLWPPKKVGAARASCSERSTQRCGERTIQPPWSTWAPPEHFPRHCDFHPVGLRNGLRGCWAKDPFLLTELTLSTCFLPGAEAHVTMQEPCLCTQTHRGPPSRLPASPGCPRHEPDAWRRDRSERCRAGRGSTGWAHPSLHHAATGNTGPTGGQHAQVSAWRCTGPRLSGRVGSKRGYRVHGSEISIIVKPPPVFALHGLKSFWKWWRI